MGRRKLIKFEDLKAFRNVLMLAQASPVRGVLASLLFQDPAVRTFLLHEGMPLPVQELQEAGSICALIGFDDANADLSNIDRAVLHLQNGRHVEELVVAPVPAWIVPHLPLLRQAARRIILCDNYKAGQVLDGVTVLSLEEFQRLHGHVQTHVLATRDDQLADLFGKAISSDVVLPLNRFLDDRLEAIRQLLGDVPVFDAAWLEAALGHVFGDNDLARVIQFAYRHLTPGSVVFDVGAHAGATTMLFRHRCASVYAFEPDPEPFASMAEGFREEPSIHPVPAALGSQSGQATLNLDHRGAVGGSSSLLGHLFTEDLRVNSAKIPVEVITLDEFCESRGILPDFIKIDVEGSEPDVVQGAWGVLSHSRPPLVYEQYRYFAELRPDDYVNMMDRLAGLYHLECLETCEDPRRRFMKPGMPPLTNIACHPRRA